MRGSPLLRSRNESRYKTETAGSRRRSSFLNSLLSLTSPTGTSSMSESEMVEAPGGSSLPVLSFTSFEPMVIKPTKLAEINEFDFRICSRTPSGPSLLKPHALLPHGPNDAMPSNIHDLRCASHPLHLIPPSSQFHWTDPMSMSAVCTSRSLTSTIAAAAGVAGTALCAFAC